MRNNKVKIYDNEKNENIQGKCQNQAYILTQA